MTYLVPREELCLKTAIGETQSFPSHALIANDENDFAAITEAHLNLLLAHWLPSRELKERIDKEEFEHLPVAEIIFPKKSELPWGQLESPLARALLQEFQPFIGIFARVTPEAKIKLTLGKSRSQPCPLFHTDKISFRLICTFRGPGTEWLRNCDVQRKALGKGSNRKVLVEGALIQSLLPFQVALFKGEKRPRDWKKGLVHRSPPLLLGEERWFIKLDGSQ